ncbi:YlxM family DNA-binding protein [Anaerosporobacter sp.]
MNDKIEKKDNNNIKQIDKLVELSLLYDFYGELLKENQKCIYEDYILNDLSLSEIAEQQGISRQGVHDVVKRCSNQLINYEEKLHLIEKFEQTKQKVSKIKELSKQIINLNESNMENEFRLQKLKETDLLTEIESLSDSILEDL